VSLAWLSWRVSEVAKLQYSPGLEIPMSYPYYGMVVGGAYLLLVVLRRLLRYAP
jgi:TRAP-type C4-dicarboxylate transport system permease small subunit